MIDIIGWASETLAIQKVTIISTIDNLKVEFDRTVNEMIMGPMRHMQSSTNLPRRVDGFSFDVTKLLSKRHSGPIRVVMATSRTESSDDNQLG